MSAPWDSGKPAWWRLRARRDWREGTGARFQSWLWEATDHGRRTLHIATLVNESNTRQDEAR